MPNAWNKYHIVYSAVGTAVETLVAPSPPGPLGTTAAGLMTLHAININAITLGTGAAGPVIQVYDYNTPTGTGVPPANSMVANIIPNYTASTGVLPVALELDCVMTIGIAIVVGPFSTLGSTASTVDLTVLWL